MLNPNISGSFCNVLYQSFSGANNITSKGGFFDDPNSGGGGAFTAAATKINGNDGIGFNASRSNNKYGTSFTVQPMSTRLLCLVRT